jgi:hypothetical protein
MLACLKPAEAANLAALKFINSSEESDECPLPIILGKNSGIRDIESEWSQEEVHRGAPPKAATLIPTLAF